MDLTFCVLLLPCKGNLLVKSILNASGLPLQDLVVGASIYFPPIFKAVLLGFLIWLVAHRQLRDWMYAGEIWHPMLMDLSLFALSVCLALVLFVSW
ncbi:hypothetical protein HMPREF0880_03653 [Yokenella regensburgei ATCC 43003]|nr:hypothetical protein HMPREF0880_03653 [Yokenella regensburgei ATCC 43003]